MKTIRLSLCLALLLTALLPWAGACAKSTAAPATTVPSGDALQATKTPKPTKTPKATKTPKPTKTPQPTAEPYLAPGQTPVITKNSYRSQQIAITITAQRCSNTDVYVADIYVKDVRSFQRAYPGTRWGKTAQRITTLSESQNAILSMTGDSANNFSAGWVIMNGQVLRDKVNRKRDIGILYTTGEMVTIPAQEIDHGAIAAAAEAGEIWQTFLFGPMLLDQDGKAMTKFNSNVGPVNPRSVIGYYAPGHYCFVQVDGRRTASALEKGKKNRGLTLTDLSLFMESLGCKAAYNLDGGQSSLMYFAGKIHSTPFKNGRRLSDIVLIKEVDAP